MLENIRNSLIIKTLKSTSPESQLEASEKKAIAIFRHAFQTVPFYRDFIVNHGINSPSEVRTIKDFKAKLPLTDKTTLYIDEKAKHIFETRSREAICSVLLSSGSSGNFSFGVATAADLRRSALFLDVMLDDYYGIRRRRTLIINTLAQAVKLPALKLTVAETGPRADSLGYLIEVLSPRFDQTIILGDPFFIKNALEDAIAGGVDVKRLTVHLIVGGVYLPESLRTYLMDLLAIDLEKPETGTIFSSMGISEFGLNLFFESAESVRLRRLVMQTPELKKTFLDENWPYLPMFFNYFPKMYFVEEVEKKIVITKLDDSMRLPLIRYFAGDVGRILNYDRIQTLVSDTKYWPTFRSPLALLYGKSDFVYGPSQKPVYPATIQQGLYESAETASKITGYFHLNSQESTLKLEIQLKKNVPLNENLRQQVKTAALKYLNIDLPVCLYSYQDFPHGMELDYEKKFKYI